VRKNIIRMMGELRYRYTIGPNAKEQRTSEREIKKRKRYRK
jgi:hypothetical protein